MSRTKAGIIVAIIALTVGIITGCGGASNSITIGEDEYDLAQGFFEEWGENTSSDQSGWDIDVYLASESIDLVEETGEGAAIFLDLNSETETLAEGTYTYSDERTSGTLYDCEAVSGDVEDDEAMDIFSIEGGTVEVTKKGDTYTISFELTTDDDTPITGSYKGELTNVEDLYSD